MFLVLEMESQINGHLLRMSPVNVGSTLFERCGSHVEKETKSDVGFSTMYNDDKASVPNVKTTLKKRCTTLIERYIDLAST